MIYFTRHGESVNNVEDRAGRPWPEDGDRLSERGWEQARGVGERLRGERIEAIVASRFGRAQDTAQAIGEVLGLGYETDPDMHEIIQPDAYYAAAPVYGETAGLYWMPRLGPDHREPGGESFNDVASRARRVSERLVEAPANTLCVSHWGFIHFFLGLALFGDDFGPRHLMSLYRISHANTGITIFEHRPSWEIDSVPFSGWSLTTWNDQAHL